MEASGSNILIKLSKKKNTYDTIGEKIFKNYRDLTISLGYCILYASCEGKKKKKKNTVKSNLSVLVIFSCCPQNALRCPPFGCHTDLQFDLKKKQKGKEKYSLGFVFLFSFFGVLTKIVPLFPLFQDQICTVHF